MTCACCGKPIVQAEADRFKGRYRCRDCVLVGAFPPEPERDWLGGLIYFIGGIGMIAAGGGLTLFSGGSVVFYGLIGVGFLVMGLGIHAAFPPSE